MTWIFVALACVAGATIELEMDSHCQFDLLHACAPYRSRVENSFVIFAPFPISAVESGALRLTSE